jgi:hypothetical protein
MAISDRSSGFYTPVLVPKNPSVCTANACWIKCCQVQWLTPVIPAILEPEMERIRV